MNDTEEIERLFSTLVEHAMARATPEARKRALLLAMEAARASGVDPVIFKGERRAQGGELQSRFDATSAEGQKAVLRLMREAAEVAGVPEHALRCYDEAVALHARRAELIAEMRAVLLALSPSVAEQEPS